MFNPNSAPVNNNEESREDLSQVPDEILMERARAAKAARDAAQAKDVTATESEIRKTREEIDAQFHTFPDSPVV